MEWLGQSLVKCCEVLIELFEKLERRFDEELIKLDQYLVNYIKRHEAEKG